MKTNFLFSGLLLLIYTSSAQDPRQILKQSYEKCQSVQNGYYEMIRYIKVMDRKDTFMTSFNCYFKKLPDDTLFSSAFHYKAFWKNEYSGDVMYTGEDFVTTSVSDSTAEIKSKSLWAEDIQSYAHNYKFYSPLTNRKSAPLQHDSDFTDDKHAYILIGEENLNGSSCYHIQVKEVPENDSTDEMKELRSEYEYWIKKENSIPVRYSRLIAVMMNKDTMVQYENNVLTQYQLNHLKDEHELTLNSIPAYFKRKDYVPYKSPELLAKETMAPDWELLSLTDQKINLKSLQGQLVLIDFFYKSCYPCMQALPALQALHEKYNEKGLRIVGIDPVDKKEDDIAVFLSKRGVTYPVLLGGKDVANDYHVSAYPTVYIIDKTGKIIFTQIGYGHGAENALDEIIKKNLSIK